MTQQLLAVNSLTHTAADGVLDCQILVDFGPGNMTIPFTYVPTDAAPMTEQLTAWLATHPGSPIGPYVPPVRSTNPSDYVLQRYQFLALLTISNLASLVGPAIAAIPDLVQRAVAQAKFDSTQEFQRDDPTLNLLTTNAGLTSAQVDTYWMQAKDL